VDAATLGEKLGIDPSILETASSPGLGAVKGAQDLIGKGIASGAEALSDDPDIQSMTRVGAGLGGMALGARGLMKGLRGSTTPSAIPRAPAAAAPWRPQPWYEMFPAKDAVPRPPKLSAPELPPGAPGPAPIKGAVPRQPMSTPPDGLARTQGLEAPLGKTMPDGPPSMSGATKAAPPPSMLDSAGPMSSESSLLRNMPVQGLTGVTEKAALPRAGAGVGQPSPTGTMVQRPPSPRSSTVDRLNEPVVPRDLDLAQPPQGAGFVPPRRLDGLQAAIDRYSNPAKNQASAARSGPPLDATTASGPPTGMTGASSAGMPLGRMAGAGLAAGSAGALAGSMLSEPQVQIPPPPNELAPPPIRAVAGPTEEPLDRIDAGEDLALPFDDILANAKTPEDLLNQLRARSGPSVRPPPIGADEAAHAYSRFSHER